MTVVFITLVVLIALILLWAVVTYNRLVRLRTQVDASWAQIDVQLQRRHSLVPNLVETVRGYAAHERTTFEAVTAARQSAEHRGGHLAAQAAAENALTSALGRLIAVAEAYPQLTASASFRDLQGELTITEGTVRSYTELKDAVRAARNAPGITEVDDRLMVAGALAGV